MEIIHELEQRERGVYCGAIGYAGPQGSCFNVPIRTVELCGGRGTMGIGSGITADSAAQDEWRECLLKGNFLTRSEPEFQLIETLLWEPENGFFLLDFHLERLRDSADYFGFVCNDGEVKRKLQGAVAGCSARQRVRLLLHRDGTLEISRTKLMEPPKAGEVARVVLSRQPVDERSPFFFHKTTRRDLFDREHARWSARGCLDVLFTNSRGQVTEGAISNVFIRRGIGEPLLTPPVSCGLLAGTCRRMLLEQGEAVEQVLVSEDLFTAAEVCIANSVRGLVRVQVEKE
jgi:para-aminobenzoate synthetase/4-amino-4-deoxychorismate lyase